MKKLQIGCIISLLALFLGWLPKMGADRVPWYLDNDFAHYYLTGALVRNGVDPYAVNLSPLYAENGFMPTRDIPQAGSPPALAVVLAPFSVLSPPVAFGIWTLVQVGALLWGVIALLRLCHVARTPQLTALVVLASLSPLGMFAHLRYGQTQALMFGLVAVGLVLVSRPLGWSWRVGAFLWGISASLKLFTAPLGWAALRYRGWEGLAWFVGGFLSLWGVFVLLCGVDSVGTFVTSTLPYLRELSSSFNGNISLSGALTYSQRIVAGIDLVPVGYIQLFCLALIAPFLVWERGERDDPVASTVEVLTVSCLVSPTSWPHYLPLLTGGFIYLLGEAQRSARPQSALTAVLMLYLCMGVSIGYLSQGDLIMRIVSAWWGPVSMLMLLVLVRQARRRAGLFRR